MGRILLVFRLAPADVRRHPAQAAMLLLTITAATAAPALGMSPGGATGTLYQQTRAATAGPDVAALTPGDDRTAASAMAALKQAPGVADHSGPHRQYCTTLTAHGSGVPAPPPRWPWRCGWASARPIVSIASGSSTGHSMTSLPKSRRISTTAPVPKPPARRLATAPSFTGDDASSVHE